MIYQKIGTEFIVQQVNDALDQWTLLVLKTYYWPFFVAGAADNITDLFKPQTYSICKL